MRAHHTRASPAPPPLPTSDGSCVGGVPQLATRRPNASPWHPIIGYRGASSSRRRRAQPRSHRMAPDDPLARKSVARAASALHVARETARTFLAMPAPVRVELLGELVRIGAGRTLALHALAEQLLGLTDSPPPTSATVPPALRGPDEGLGTAGTVPLRTPSRPRVPRAGLRRSQRSRHVLGKCRAHGRSARQALSAAVPPQQPSPRASRPVPTRQGARTRTPTATPSGTPQARLHPSPSASSPRSPYSL